MILFSINLIKIFYFELYYCIKFEIQIIKDIILYIIIYINYI